MFFCHDSIRNNIVKVYLCACLTKWWLQHASVLLTVANRLDLRGVHQAPEVVLVVRPVQTQPQP